ncbi:glutaminase A [Alphaproteobacteria bacterium]|nr:glutaminase A [Alphaproteobacteria bacterium]
MIERRNPQNQDISQIKRRKGEIKSPIAEAIGTLYNKYKDCKEGEVATYIPKLADVDHDAFSISLTTINGQRYSVGDKDIEFSMMSCAKPVVYGIALEEYGTEDVQERVGVEPTGDRFDSIIKLDSSNRPHNAMINAGAIVISDMIKGPTPEERLKNILDTFEGYTGRKHDIDMDMFTSSKKAGHRNRALGHLLLGVDELNRNVDDTLDLYCQQCAINVTSQDLALIGATLANKGKNPRTDVQALQAEHTRSVLSVMLTCGLYDYSGEWVYDVGLPAKTSVSGGTLVAIPGVGGLGIHSPRLDKFGNSIRGLKVCEDLSQDLGLHIFDADYNSLNKKALMSEE